MASKNETVTAVLAEWRDCIESADPSVWNDERIAGLVKTTKAQQIAYLDRIEAAWKREREKIAAETRQRSAADSGCPNVSKNTDVIIAQSSPVVNAAEMREALEHVEKLASEFAVGNYYVSDFPKMLLDAIRTALSAPRRNCDVGTPAEQSIRYEKFCFEHRTMERCCEDCPIKDEPCCELAWAQMPYGAQEGGAK